MKKTLLWLGAAFLLPALLLGVALGLSSGARQASYKVVAEFGPKDWQSWAIEKVEPGPEAVFFYLSVEFPSRKSQRLIDKRLRDLGAKALPPLLAIAERFKDENARFEALDKIQTLLKTGRAKLETEQTATLEGVIDDPDPMVRSQAMVVISTHYSDHPEALGFAAAQRLLDRSPKLEPAGRLLVYACLEQAASHYSAEEQRALLDRLLALEDRIQSCQILGGRLTAQLARRLGRPVLEELFERRFRALKAEKKRPSSMSLDHLAFLGSAMGGYPKAARPAIRELIRPAIRACEPDSILSAIGAAGPLGASEGAALLPDFDAIYEELITNQRTAVGEALVVMAFVDPEGAYDLGSAWSEREKRPLYADQWVFLGNRHSTTFTKLRKRLSTRRPALRAASAAALWLAKGHSEEAAEVLTSSLIEAAADPLSPDDRSLLYLQLLARKDKSAIAALAAACEEARGPGVWALRDCLDRIRAEESR